MTRVKGTGACKILGGERVKTALEQEVEGRRPVGRSKKTWSKVVEEDMRKLNITEDYGRGCRKQWRQHITSNP